MGSRSAQKGYAWKKWLINKKVKKKMAKIAPGVTLNHQMNNALDGETKRRRDYIADLFLSSMFILSLTDSLPLKIGPPALPIMIFFSPHKNNWLNRSVQVQPLNLA